MIKDFAKDMFKYLPAQIVPAIIGFISIPIITRLFSSDDYGNYSLVVATIGVLTTLLGWLPMSIIRFYPVYERDRRLDIFYGNITKLVFISIAIVAAVFLIFFFSIKTGLSSELYLFMYLGVGVFIVTAVFDVLQYFLRSKREVNWYTKFALWRSIMGFGLALGLIFLFKLGIESLFLGIILSAIVVLPLLWRKAIGSTLVVMSSKIDFSLVKEMAKYSFPLVIANLAAWILSLSDRYILEFFRGSQEVGIYSASYNITSQSIMFIITLFTLASGPISMHIWEKEGEKKSKEFTSKTTRYYLMICIPAVVGLSVLAKPLIGILVGRQFFEGYKIVPLVALGSLFLGLQQNFQVGFSYYKKTGTITFAVAVSGLLNLLLNFIFVPKHGYIAAAASTLISYAFLLLLMIIFSYRFFAWKFPFKSLVTSICASAIMGILVYYIGNKLTFPIAVNLILGICIGILIYFALLFLLNEIEPREKEVIKRILKRGVASLC